MDTQASEAQAAGSKFQPRTYLMCSPDHFTVEYTINPWMDTTQPVDTDLAKRQWTNLVEAVQAAGHTVHLLQPEPNLPDMVFAANGSLVVDGVAYGAKFRYPQRQLEAAAHEKWFRSHGWPYVAAEETNEGEGDFTYVEGPGLILAGWGFRTDGRAHAEAADALGRPVVSLRLADPRFYHLDTVLAVLDDHNITYYPGAFTPGSQRLLERLFPDAVIADEVDAEAFGLNLVSDGHNVFINTEAAGMAKKMAAAGFNPVSVDLSELKKSGGSVKCCISELRS
ncbi:dimethylargininase [Natronoglycomyces albus]